MTKPRSHVKIREELKHFDKPCTNIQIYSVSRVVFVGESSGGKRSSGRRPRGHARGGGYGERVSPSPLGGTTGCHSLCPLPRKFFDFLLLEWCILVHSG